MRSWNSYCLLVILLNLSRYYNSLAYFNSFTFDLVNELFISEGRLLTFLILLCIWLDLFNIGSGSFIFKIVKKQIVFRFIQGNRYFGPFFMFLDPLKELILFKTHLLFNSVQSTLNLLDFLLILLLFLYYWLFNSVLLSFRRLLFLLFLLQWPSHNLELTLWFRPFRHFAHIIDIPLFHRLS